MVPGANAGTSDTPFRLTFPYFELKRFWRVGENVFRTHSARKDTGICINLMDE